MFTGIIEEIGEIAQVSQQGGARQFSIKAQKVMSDLKVDDSIAINGVCLTVVSQTPQQFAVQAVEETLKKSTLGHYQAGHRINLERALMANSRLGGHFVQGHVDGVATVLSMQAQQGGKILTLRVPEMLLKYMIPQGSITVDGVSLTIAGLSHDTIRISLIPHTLSVTTLGMLQAGGLVNVEADMMGKYAIQILQPYAAHPLKRTMYDVKLED